MKAIVLLSGGLDSTLAAKVMLEQGIELEALNYMTLFCTCTPRSSCQSSAKTATDQLHIPLRTISVTKEFMDVVRDPPHGYGRNMNPCIDCRILMLKKARAIMEESGASFLVTGEVLGERPMSQRRDALRIVERDSGLEGLILRPLSARLLPPTIPEKEGWVDREKLLAISGRSRKPQIALAAQYGLQDYPCPAGGCLLTDSRFAARLRDLLKHTGETSMSDIRLLKIGRHFRLSEKLKAVVGRDKDENEHLERLMRDDDLWMKATDFEGPLTLLRGARTKQDELVAAGITARYGKGKDEREVRVTVREGETGEESILTAAPAVDADLEPIRI